MNPLVNIATEDELSEAVAARIVAAACGGQRIGLRLGRKGNAYLRKKMADFARMAAREPILILTDLDATPCPSALLNNWTNAQNLPPNLLLRVAVREIEAWLMADRDGMANLLGISRAKMPEQPSELADPKRFLLNLAKSAKREVRSELVVPRGAIASQGLGYNRLLSQFVATDWNLTRASEHSPSLQRAFDRLQELADRI